MPQLTYTTARGQRVPGRALVDADAYNARLSGFSRRSRMRPRNWAASAP